MTRKRVVVSEEAVKRAVRRSVRASAKLENREVPADYVRPEAVQRYIDESSSRWASGYRPEPKDDGEPAAELPLET
jgi:antitoxin VapB